MKDYVLKGIIDMEKLSYYPEEARVLLDGWDRVISKLDEISLAYKPPPSDETACGKDDTTKKQRGAKFKRNMPEEMDDLKVHVKAMATSHQVEVTALKARVLRLEELAMDTPSIWKENFQPFRGEGGGE